MTVVRLTAAPNLAPLLARGAVLSPLKRVREGAVAPPSRLVLPQARVDRGRLAAYREVCGFPPGDPGTGGADREGGGSGGSVASAGSGGSGSASGSGSAGGSGCSVAELPVTYPHILGFPLAMRLMAARDFPLPLLGLVHTSLEIDQHRPLTADEPPELTVYAEKLSPHRRGTEATLVTEARLDGKLVWDSRSTYLARHATSYDGGPERAGAFDGPLPVRAEWSLPGDLGRRYGAASGDRNPIHLHPLTARLFGFPRAIAHGMWTVARCLAEQGACGSVRVRAEFRAPVLLPGRVSYGAAGERFELRGAGPEGKVHVSGVVS